MKRTNTYIDFLDYLRAAAIIAVFLYHCLDAAFGYDRLQWGPIFRDFSPESSSWSFLLLLPLSYGYAGVALFFVVSGFCVHLSYAHSTQRSWHTFLLRRFCRIYPPYLVALILFGVILPAIVPMLEPFNNVQFSIHLLLIHNFHKATAWAISPSFWSIAVEFQLYALYPLLYAAVSRWGWQRSLAVIGCIEVALRLWQGVHYSATGSELPTFVTLSPFAHWFSWSIGAWLADAYIHNRKMPLGSTSPWLWLLLALLFHNVKLLYALNFLMFAVCTAAFVSRFLQEGASYPVREWFSPLVLQRVRNMGLWSYSIYLLHQPLLHLSEVAAAYFNVRIHPIPMLLVCAAMWFLIVPISAWFYQRVELPSMKLGRRLASYAAVEVHPSNVRAS